MRRAQREVCSAKKCQQLATKTRKAKAASPYYTVFALSQGLFVAKVYFFRVLCAYGWFATYVLFFCDYLTSPAQVIPTLYQWGCITRPLKWGSNHECQLIMMAAGARSRPRWFP